MKISAIKKTINKILVFLTFILNSDAYFESPPLYFYPDGTFDFVRPKSYSDIDLKEGDIAWFLSENADVWIDSNDITGESWTDPTVAIGPGTLSNYSSSTIRLKIDRKSNSKVSIQERF